MRSFRAWKVADCEDASIEELLLEDRKKEDRSQFVRYARISARWNEWVKSGKLIQSDAEAHFSHAGWHFGIVHLDTIELTETVLPRDKEPHQRLLEATQIYFEPIIVNQRGEVIANHELAAAAKSIQSELSRPGKERPSDLALVATPRLNIELSEALEPSELENYGFAAESSGTSDLAGISISVGKSVYSNRCPSPSQYHWFSSLTQTGSNSNQSFGVIQVTEGHSINPQRSDNTERQDFQHARLKGAIMWSPRPFSNL